MTNGIQPDALIAQYCDLNAVFQAVSHKKYSIAAAEIDKAMRQIAAEQTDPEALEIFANCLQIVMQYDIFYRLLDAIGCELTETYEARAAMRADYEAWKSGSELSDAAWLSQPHSAVKIRLFKAPSPMNFHLLSAVFPNGINSRKAMISARKTFDKIDAAAEIFSSVRFFAAQNIIRRSDHYGNF